MYPEHLFSIFGVGINSYLLAYISGFFASIGLALVLTREKRLPHTLVIDLCFLVAAAAYTGGRLYYAVLFQKLSGWEVFTGRGVASIGAICGVLFAVLLFVRVHPKIRSQAFDYVDISVTSVALYSVFARIGCFSAGCCHGKPAYDLPWAVIFSKPSCGCIFKGIPVHPTQLYMAAGNFCILILLLRLRNRQNFRGNLLWVYGICYGLLRFAVEFFRGDVRPMIGALSWNQWICLGFVIIGSLMLVRKFRSLRALRLTPSS